MTFSQVARDIAPSPTLALNEEARLLREKGEPVIHLGAGEPKNRAPVTAIPNPRHHPCFRAMKNQNGAFRTEKAASSPTAESRGVRPGQQASQRKQTTSRATIGMLANTPR